MNIISLNAIQFDKFDFLTDILLYSDNLLYINLDNVSFPVGLLNSNDQSMNLIVKISKMQFDSIIKVLKYISKMGFYIYTFNISTDEIHFQIDDNSYFIKIDVPLASRYYDHSIGINDIPINSNGNIIIRFDIIKKNNSYFFQLILIDVDIIDKIPIKFTKKILVGKETKSRDW